MSFVSVKSAVAIEKLFTTFQNLLAQFGLLNNAYFKTVADMKAATWLTVGMVAHTDENSTGKGGGGVYDVVAGQAVDGFSDHLTVGGLALLLRIGDGTTIKHFGAKLEVGIDDSPAATAMMNKMGVIRVDGSIIQFDSPITIGSGQQFLASGPVYDGLPMAGTMVVVDTDITPLKVAGRHTTLKGFGVINTGVSTKPAIECVDNQAYFNSFEDIVTKGFKNGVRGERSLYHTHKNCNYDDCEIGANYIGAEGAWNTVWFNNVIKFDRCTFRRSSVQGVYAKGVCIEFDSPDVASSPIGIEVVGDAGNASAFSTVIKNLYSENTNNPLKFVNATAQIIGGFSQGFGVPVLGDTVIVADSSRIEIVGKLDGQSLWDKWAELSNGSALFMSSDGFSGVSGGLLSKVQADASSSLELATVRTEGVTSVVLSGGGQENLFTPSLDGTFLVSAVSPSFSNMYWTGIVQKAGGSSLLRILAFHSNRTTMNDNAGVLQIQNDDLAQDTAYEWNFIKIGGR